MKLQLRLMINASEAHKLMFYDNIMHDEYVKFVNEHHVNTEIKFMIEKFMNIYESSRHILFNMHYINQKYFVKFNKIFVDQNKIFKNHDHVNTDEFLTVEVEDSEKIYKYSNEKTIENNLQMYEYYTMYIISVSKHKFRGEINEYILSLNFGRGDHFCHEYDKYCMYIFQINL